MPIASRLPALFCVVSIIAVIVGAAARADEAGPAPLRIMPVGDSITRGTYIATKNGKPIGLPSPDGGGWRKPLQDKLRAAGLAFDFVGAIDFMAYGTDGVCDPQFDPDHHGLAGFGNRGIRQGGVVPTPQDVLDSRGVKEIRAPDIVAAMKQCRPDVVLLMSGANGFDAQERDLLIQTILDNLSGQLLVATIPPQRAPRRGFERVGDYNASLPATVARFEAAGRKIRMVDMAAALTADDLTPDGVHPNQQGTIKIAEAWLQGMKDAGLVPKQVRRPGE